MENPTLDIKTIHSDIIAPSYEMKYIIRDGYEIKTFFPKSKYSFDYDRKNIQLHDEE